MSSLTPAVLLFAAMALAHGGESSTMSMGAENHTVDTPEEPQTPNSYFNYPKHSGALFAHIVIMCVAWVVSLPVAVMFSIARSRFTIVSQLVFGALNALGVFIAIGYNASTPDLYPNNAHHKLGWIVTVTLTTQFAIGIVGKLAGVLQGLAKPHTQQYEQVAFIPTESSSQQLRSPGPYRLSDDSGHSTVHSSSSHSRSSSASTVAEHAQYELNNMHKEHFDEEEDVGFASGPAFIPGSATKWTRASETIAGFFSARVWRIFAVYYDAVDRVILPLGFVTLACGIVTVGRFFEDTRIYSGLAHWIKGGIFFWLGLLTLGRWSGSFGDFGWAWNIRPRRAGQGWRPTAEFTESFLIFVYGITNVFLEHLGSQDGVWTHQDLEHLSITILFIGGGACGMLIESSVVRELLNTTVDESISVSEGLMVDRERGEIEKPGQYSFSMNPIPAVVILLLGIMMSSHEQPSMISTMVHKQWGDLLAAASFSRALTYIILWLRPPTSVYPSRPPTELLTSFGLIAGGLIFMASASDTVDAIIRNQLDAMFLYTVTMGIVGLLMAWVLFVLALKGWAVRKEKAWRA
ncbi:hypothetical protein TD95_002099 [Thielaviopsis punctulata]|uniref:Protein YTP1-like C-terminal domain-containing protein n=1 Tax=Thielaviopsis punctulata TaxID=72032 RepID=A0A0F4ZBI4_9PEZI|nr:hypothetical protein TD95_002099 [Thielaviopsis punctulata]